MLENLPIELLALVCRRQRDRRVFRRLNKVCRTLQAKINSRAFLEHRALVARNGVDLDQLHGVSYANTTPLTTLKPFLPHVSTLLNYLKHTSCIDWAAGHEDALLTLDTRVRVAGVNLFSEMPDACVSIFSGDEDFVYEAGPRPCPWMLQIFRSGAPKSRHYGLRTLESIREGDFVCAYWGEYEKFEELESCRNSRSQDSSEHHAFRLRVAVESEPPFTIDPTARGNLARWINHGDRDANLTPSLVYRSPDRAADSPLVALHATRDISAGEELLWSYRSYTYPHPPAYKLGSFFKSTSWRPQVHRQVDEMLRTECGRCIAATWAPCRPRLVDEHQDHMKLLDVLAVQGFPPAPSSTPEERRLHAQTAYLHELPALPNRKRWSDAQSIADGSDMGHPRQAKFHGWLGAWWPSHEVVRK